MSNNDVLKIDRSAVDKAIKGLDGMFSATEKVLQDYEAEKEALEQRGQDLDNQLETLQQQHVELLLQKEGEKDTKKFIALSKKIESINEEIKLIAFLQEQLKEDKTALKAKYMPIIRETYNKDSSARNNFNVNESVRNIGNELKQAIKDYEKAIYDQDKQVMSVIHDDFLDDKELMNESWDDVSRRKRALAFKRTFDWDRNKLFYDKEIKL